MKVNRRHKNRFLSGWKTTVTAVLAFLCLLPDPALSQKANSNDETAGVESVSSNISMRSSIGQPLIGRMSGVSIRGFAGLLYRISQPPRIESVPPTAVLEDSLYKYQVTASDANGDSILYSIVEGPAGMQLTAAGEILWTPTQNEVGSNDVMLAVYDARGDSSFQSWSIEVTNLNDPPEITLPDTLASLPEDSSVVISFVPFISDVDNGLDDLILSAEIIYSQGFEIVNGQQSGRGFISKKVIEAEFSESRFNRFKVSAFDEPGFRSMGISASTSTLIISIDDSAKSVTLSGMPDSSGVFRVVFSVSDPDSSTASDTTIILITPRNDAPVVSNLPDISFLEDSTFTIDLDAFVFDVDNDTSELNWTAELADADSGTVLTIGNGDGGRNLKRTDLVTLTGDRMKVTLRGKGRTDSAGLSNSISHANRNKRRTVRKAVDFEQRLSEPAEYGEIIVEMRKITRMKSVITMSSQSGETLDSVIISIDSTSHIATFTTTANYFAADIQIIFTATDPDGLADSDSSLLTIEPVNDAPELSALPDIVFNEDDTLVVYFADWFDFVTDPDNPDSTLSWSVTTTDSDSVNVIIQGDSVIFTAPQDWFAFDRDTLIVTVTDSALESSVRLAVHVLPVNDAPSLDFIPDTLSFGNDTSLVMSFDSIDVDVDDPDSLLTWFAAFSDSSSDTLIFFDILGDSAIRISSVPGWIGEDTLTIVVMDTSGARDTTIVLIRVTAPVSVEDHIGILPLQFEVFQNYPNPFNPTTTIRYALPKRSDVTIEIYNLMGQLVTRIHKENVRAGYHEERWNGVNQRGVPLASGVYIYRLRAGEYVRTKKMLLLK